MISIYDTNEFVVKMIFKLRIIGFCSSNLIFISKWVFDYATKLGLKCYIMFIYVIFWLYFDLSIYQKNRLFVTFVAINTTCQIYSFNWQTKCIHLMNANKIVMLIGLYGMNTNDWNL